MNCCATAFRGEHRIEPPPTKWKIRLLAAPLGSYSRDRDDMSEPVSPYINIFIRWQIHNLTPPADLRLLAELEQQVVVMFVEPLDVAVAEVIAAGTHHKGAGWDRSGRAGSGRRGWSKACRRPEARRAGRSRRLRKERRGAPAALAASLPVRDLGAGIPGVFRNCLGAPM